MADVAPVLQVQVLARNDDARQYLLQELLSQDTAAERSSSAAKRETPDPKTGRFPIIHLNDHSLNLAAPDVPYATKSGFVQNRLDLILRAKLQFLQSSLFHLLL